MNLPRPGVGVFGEQGDALIRFPDGSAEFISFGIKQFDAHQVGNFERQPERTARIAVFYLLQCGARDTGAFRQFILGPVPLFPAELDLSPK